MSGTPFILYIPDVALEKVFSFLTYDEIAKNRQVCARFNEIGSRMLSRGFIQLEKRHSTIYKRVKSLLPRRESERKVHPLARHCDILQAVETRLSMLNMTYMKYVESNLLCFIPGKVLDEMLNVLTFVESDCTPPRTHQLLQELRDLSSMAMEHFDEHILPRVKELKERMDERRQVPAIVASISGKSNVRQAAPFFVQQANDIQKVKKQYKAYKRHVVYMNQLTQELIHKIRKQNKRLRLQYMKLREHERKIQEQSAKIQEQETALTDVKKHMDEWNQKYKDLTTELARARDCMLLKTSSPTETFQTSAPKSPVPSKIYRSSIRPRVSHLFFKNYNNLSLDLERKRKSSLLPDIPVKVSRSQNEDRKAEEAAPALGAETDKDGKGDFMFFSKHFIRRPFTGRKRKILEDIDLK